MAYTFGVSPLDSLINGLRSSTKAADAGVGAAQSGVNAVLGRGGQIQQAISNMNAQAGNVIGQGNAVNQTAQEVKDTYAKLGPIADFLSQYGIDLNNEWAKLSGQADSLYGQGNALLNMDANAGGLVGEFLKMFNFLSPDRYVAQGASDTQASFQNALGQAERNLSRRGISATSGAFGALQNQFAKQMAVATAAIKTKMRQYGIDQQKEWLGNMANVANTLLGTANQTEANALNAKNAAVSAHGQAANAISAQGQGLAQAGSLQQSAGQLFASAAGIFGDAGQLQTSYLSLVNQAYGNLSKAQFNKSDAYRQAVATEVSAVNGGGGGGGGVRVTQSPEDDWMTWRGTGHSQTWNKNDGFHLARELGVI